jgi:MraZ protein
MLRSAETLFLGSHINKVDAKGRIAAPADFRRALKLDSFNGFYCVPSLRGPFLECGGADFIENLQAMIAALDPFDPDRADLQEALIGQARPIPFDGDGRFILPQPLREHAGIGERVLLMGCGEIFQIRDAQGAAERLAAAAERARKALGKLRNPPVLRVGSEAR